MHRFWAGTLTTTDTLVICKIKAVSLNNLTGLQELIDKGFAFVENYDLCDIYEPPQCEGMCGDANKDTRVNVSDAVYLINYVFSGGNPPSTCSPGSWTGGDCCEFVPSSK